MRPLVTIFVFCASYQLPGETNFYEGLNLISISSLSLMPLWMNWLTSTFLIFFDRRKLTLAPLLLPLPKGCTQDVPNIENGCMAKLLFLRSLKTITAASQVPSVFLSTYDSSSIKSPGYWFLHCPLIFTFTNLPLV